LIVCGNGVVEPGEICDDKNNVDNDGCKADCSSLETCGDGVLNRGRGEQCDDNNNVNADGCQANCQFAFCGDGIVDATEACDAGAANSSEPSSEGTPFCRTNCQFATCGDGVLDTGLGEVCDDSNRRDVIAGTNDFDGCAANCLSNQTCGNGYLDFNPDPAKSEECDPQASVVGLSHDGCSSTCKREVGDWTLLPAPIPPRRNQHGMVYDARRNKLVLFGGVGTDGYLNDTWEWDIVSASWQKRTPVHAPPNRIDPGLVFDAARGVVILFGGYSGYIGYLNDTWQWDGNDWTQLVTANAPSPRYLFGISYDTDRQVTMLFGGYAQNGVSSELWQFNGTNWQLVTTAGDIISPRYLAAQAYDPVRKKLVIFGGAVPGIGQVDETWQWDAINSRWQKMQPTHRPYARYTALSVFDETNGRVLLYGGGYNDSWTWDGSDWTQLDLLIGPSVFSQSAMAFVSSLGTTLLYGGNRDQAENVLWALQGNLTWYRRYDASEPSPRSLGSAAISSIDGTMLMFGANDYTLQDTWTWKSNLGWRLAASNIVPPQRRSSSIVFDSRRNRFLMFGGRSAVDGSDLGDLWRFENGQWTLVPTAGGPTRRHGTTAFYDPQQDKVVLFGGQGDGNVYNETWEFDCDSRQWSMVPTTTGGPPVSQNGTMVYDSIHHRGILTFGYPYIGTADSTWAYDPLLRQWSKLPVNADGPKGRDWATAVYDPNRDSLVLFGGVYGGDVLRDMWELHDNRWQQLTPRSLPGASLGGVAAYDVSSSAIIFFGGGGADNSNDTWLWRWTSIAARDQACPAVGAPGNVDTDGDGLDSDHDPDCWWRRTPNCPPGTSCH
jgi:cysteine-rich repeat protein